MTVEISKLTPLPVRETTKQTKGEPQSRTDIPNGSKTVSAKEIAAELDKVREKIDAEKYLNEILHITSTFNKRLKFNINEELNRVVVKVIDRETDKVIKEIPPEALQKLYIRIKEAIGLIVDETI